MPTKYDAFIGLEVHVQLLTPRKIFAPEQASYGAPPNTQTSPVTLGHPGTLPTLNKEAITCAVTLGLALNAEITRHNTFDRKSYTYPDLPKGFQITQDKTPICRNGTIPLPTQKAIRLERIHLEEDTGKSMHTDHHALINYNRAGRALLEIVTKPDITSAEEAALCLTEIQKIVRYLDISNGNMEEGSLRCDVNISIRPQQAETLGNKVELKNMNSIREVRLASQAEIARQQAIKTAGGQVASETRVYDAKQGTTVYRRTKEGLSDYRYFTEPDLSPFHIDDAWLHELQQHMPRLPHQWAERFHQRYRLPPETIATLTTDKAISRLFDAICQHTTHYKIAANWLIGPVKSYLNRDKIAAAHFPLQPQRIAQLADIVGQQLLSFSVAAEQLFSHLLQDPQADPYEVIQKHHLSTDDPLLASRIQELLARYPKKVAAYRQGKTSLFGFFMGEAMRTSNRKANPQQIQKILQRQLGTPAV